MIKKIKRVVFGAGILMTFAFNASSDNGDGTEPPPTKESNIPFTFIKVSTKKQQCEHFPKIHWAGTSKIMPNASSKYLRFTTQKDNLSTEECRIAVPTKDFEREFQYCALSGVLTTKPSSLHSCDFSKARDSKTYRFFAKFEAESRGVCKFVCVARASQ